MKDLVLHERMIRVSDGALGQVVRSGSDNRLRITYKDRDAWLIAKDTEQWEPAALPRMGLRDTEKMLVAQAADMKLHALLKHEPDRFWESPPDVPHDQGLVDVIMEYLSK